MFKSWFNKLFEKPSDPNSPPEVVAYRRSGLGALLFMFSISSRIVWQYKAFESLKKANLSKPLVKQFPMLRINDDIDYFYLSNILTEGALAIHTAVIGGYVAEQIAFDKEIRTTPPFTSDQGKRAWSYARGLGSRGLDNEEALWQFAKKEMEYRLPTAQELIQAHWEAVNALAVNLLEQKELTYQQVGDIIRPKLPEETSKILFSTR